MKFLAVSVRTAMVVHGYGPDNREIVEAVHEEAFVEKLLLLERIQSVSERYILVSSSHGRVMYWEYQGGFEAMKRKLREAGLLIGE